MRKAKARCGEVCVAGEGVSEMWGNRPHREGIREMDERANKVIELACKFIEDRTGSCPLDLLDVEPFDKPCVEMCKPCRPTDQCWRAYFIEEAGRDE